MLRRALGVLFVGASVIQGLNPKLFAALVPESFRKNSEQIQGVMTGALAGIGVAFLIPHLRLVGRWAATALLVGSLPAAIDQVRNPPKAVKESGLPPAVSIVRIPAQLLVTVLVWIATKKSTGD